MSKIFDSLKVGAIIGMAAVIVNYLINKFTGRNFL